jgi:hypothetical protein
MESLFNGLFEFKSQKELDEYLLEKIDKKTALKIIELSIESLQVQGAYSLAESFTLYKCLSKLKENEDNIETDNLRDDDNHGDIN